MVRERQANSIFVVEIKSMGCVWGVCVVGVCVCAGDFPRECSWEGEFLGPCISRKEIFSIQTHIFHAPTPDSRVGP